MVKSVRLCAVGFVLLAMLPGRASAEPAPTVPGVLAAQRELGAASGLLRRPQVSAETAAISGYGGATAIGDSRTCTVVLFADVWCWTEADPAPVRVSATGGLRGKQVLGVVAGRAHTCALVLDEGSFSAFCWGDNDRGQLGDGSLDARARPVEVAAGVIGIAAGGDHTCVVDTELTVSCWGRNDLGQLGLGTAGPGEPASQQVPGLADIVDISAGENNTCAVDADGRAYCWGSDTHGQLGDGGGASGTPAVSPVPVTAVPGGFTQISVGRRHVCAVAGAGLVGGPAYCWGSDSAGQTGTGAAPADVDRPQPVAGGRAYASVSAGGDSTCALAAAGRQYCWGDNTDGQLGTGDTTGRPAPAAADQRNVQVSPTVRELTGAGASMVVESSVGPRQSCAVDPVFTVYCTRPSTGLLTRVPLGPGPMRAPRVTAAAGSITAAWQAPDPGAAPIAAYVAVALSARGDVGSAETCGTTGGLRCRIPGLVDDRRYRVFLVAIGPGGISYSPLRDATPHGGGGGAGGGGGGLPITGPGGLPVAGLLLIGLGYALCRGGRVRHASGGPAGDR